MWKAIQLWEDFVLFTAEQEATKVWRWSNLNLSSILSSNTRCLFQSFQFFKPSLLCGREEQICEDFFQALNTPLGKVDVIYHFLKYHFFLQYCSWKQFWFRKLRKGTQLHHIKSSKAKKPVHFTILILAIKKPSSPCHCLLDSNVVRCTEVNEIHPE